MTSSGGNVDLEINYFDVLAPDLVLFQHSVAFENLRSGEPPGRERRMNFIKRALRDSHPNAIFGYDGEGMLFAVDRISESNNMFTIVPIDNDRLTVANMYSSTVTLDEKNTILHGLNTILRSAFLYATHNSVDGGCVGRGRSYFPREEAALFELDNQFETQGWWGFTASLGLTGDGIKKIARLSLCLNVTASVSLRRESLRSWLERRIGMPINNWSPADEVRMNDDRGRKVNLICKAKKKRQEFYAIHTKTILH
eukprot:GHVR01048847.1.p1 GENE.GHVR01048847.1~~GHVR01048847.1.p1  ORF type:complete len:254 (+),score=57.40 GHVR01048847.1:78-839(+)